jgi:hypothetical protein
MVSTHFSWTGGWGEGVGGGAACPATEKSEEITRAEPFQFFILLRFYLFIYEKNSFRIVCLKGLAGF